MKPKPSSSQKQGNFLYQDLLEHIWPRPVVKEKSASSGTYGSLSQTQSHARHGIGNDGSQRIYFSDGNVKTDTHWLLPNVRKILDTTSALRLVRFGRTK